MGVSDGRQGDADYIGEDISQLEHCLQAAALAKEDGELSTMKLIIKVRTTKL